MILLVAIGAPYLTSVNTMDSALLSRLFAYSLRQPVAPNMRKIRAVMILLAAIGAPYLTSVNTMDSALLNRRFAYSQ